MRCDRITANSDQRSNWFGVHTLRSNAISGRSTGWAKWAHGHL